MLRMRHVEYWTWVAISYTVAAMCYNKHTGLTGGDEMWLFLLLSSTLGNHGSRSSTKISLLLLKYGQSTEHITSSRHWKHIHGGVTLHMLTFYISDFSHSNKLLYLLPNFFFLWIICIFISMFGSFLLVVHICANSLETLPSCYCS